MEDLCPSPKMGSRNWMILMLLTLLVVIATPSGACQCYDWHLQNHFCQSQTVIRAEFLSVYERNNSLQSNKPERVTKGYNIKLKEIFKGEHWPRDVIFAPIMLGTSCIYNHDPSNFNSDHLIAGFRRGDELFVDSCSFIKPWRELSPKQILGIQRAYQKACTCNVIPCLSLVPCKPTVNQCVFQRYRGDFQNQDRNQICCLNETGICHWETIMDTRMNTTSPHPPTPGQTARAR